MCSAPDFRQKLEQYDAYRWHAVLLLYIPPFLIVIGTFGNVFSIFVLRNRAMLRFSTYFFLMVMSIADTLVLYVGLLPLWLGALTGDDFRDRSAWTCKLTNVVGSTVSDYSVWLIVAVTAERYLVVSQPFKAASSACTGTEPTARRLTGVLLVVFVLFNLHLFWTVTVVEFPPTSAAATFGGGGAGDTAAAVTTAMSVVRQCSAVPEHAALVLEVWPWVDAFVYSVLPFVAILVLNALIVSHLVKARRQRDCLLRCSSGSQSSQLQPPHFNQRQQQRRPSQEGSTRLTLMLLTISFAFLLTTAPMIVVNASSRFCDKDNLLVRSRFTLARTVAELLMYANHSVNFFLYCATGQKFRHQLVWMLCYGGASGGSGSGAGGGMPGVSARRAAAATAAATSTVGSLNAIPFRAIINCGGGGDDGGGVGSRRSLATSVASVRLPQYDVERSLSHFDEVRDKVDRRISGGGSGGALNMSCLSASTTMDAGRFCGGRGGNDCGGGRTSPPTTAATYGHKLLLLQMNAAVAAGASDDDDDDDDDANEAEAMKPATEIEHLTSEVNM